MDLSGLSEILDAAPTYLNLPGQRLAVGRFSEPRVDGTDQAGAFIVAFDVSASPATLALLPFGGGQGCRTGRADSFQTSPFSARSSFEAYEQYITDVSGTDRQLHFVDSSCKEPLAPIDATNRFAINPAQPFTDPPGFLVRTNSGDLVFVEPWVPEKTTVASGVASVSVTPKQVWTLENVTDPATGITRGQVVVRDLLFNELARFGTNVSQLTVRTSSPVEAAFIDIGARTASSMTGVTEALANGNVATTREGPPTTAGSPATLASTPAGGELFLVTDALETPKSIDTDACGPNLPSGYGGLAYVSPCETRNLVLYGAADQSDQDKDTATERYPLGEFALGPPAVRFLGNTGYYFFVAQPDPKQTNGALYGGAIGSEPVHIADHPTLSSFVPRVTTRSDTFQFIVDVTTVNKSQVGTLVAWTPKGTLTTLSQNVEEVDGNVGVVNFDGTTGDLVEIHASAVSSPLASGVPSGGVSSSSVGLAVIADASGSVGTLLVSGPDTIDLEPAATQVATSSFDFVESLSGVAYLHDYDETTGEGTLGVRVIDTGDTFDAGIRASEWEEVGWPQPGILYVVPSGSKEGIWFASLK